MGTLIPSLSSARFDSRREPPLGIKEIEELEDDVPGG
jgi:hypothetical protein